MTWTKEGKEEIEQTRSTFTTPSFLFPSLPFCSFAESVKASPVSCSFSSSSCSSLFFFVLLLFVSMGDENEEMEIDEPTSSGGERKRFEVKKVRHTIQSLHNLQAHSHFEMIIIRLQSFFYDYSIDFILAMHKQFFLSFSFSFPFFLSSCIECSASGTLLPCGHGISSSTTVPSVVITSWTSVSL